MSRDLLLVPSMHHPLVREPLKTILKWAGGKARLADQIEAAFREPCKGTYYEPFAGSAAVLLYRKARGSVKRAVLSDANAKLMAVHRAVRDDVEGLLAALAEMPTDDWRERYYDVRAMYNEGPWEGPKHAARLSGLIEPVSTGFTERIGKANTTFLAGAMCGHRYLLRSAFGRSPI